MGKRKDHAGKKYNKWTVITYIGPDKRSKDAVWLCKCDCGIEKELKINNLITGKSRQCTACALKPRIYKDILPEVMWNLILKRAKRKQHEIDITREEAEELYLKQNRLCSLSALPISFAESGTDYLKGNQTASLDRIDSKKGYVKGNVQWVHKSVNLMKNTLNQSQFINICKLIARNEARKD